MKTIITFYGHFFKVLFLLIILSAFFGIFNERFIELVSHTTIGELTESSSTFKYLYFAQFSAFLTVVFVLYVNKLQFIGFLRRENGKKLSARLSSLILSVSGFLLLLPFLFLITKSVMQS